MTFIFAVIMTITTYFILAALPRKDWLNGPLHMLLSVMWVFTIPALILVFIAYGILKFWSYFSSQGDV